MNLNDEKLYCEHLDTLRLFIRFLLHTGFFYLTDLCSFFSLKKTRLLCNTHHHFSLPPISWPLTPPPPPPPPPSNEIKRTGFAELVFIRVNKSFCWAGYGAGGNQTFFRSAPRPPGKQSQSFTI